jgi:ATP-binding cassette subfamily B protein
MFILVIALAVLPALSLSFNREVIAQLSNYIMHGTGSFEDILPPLLTFGVILMLVGLSSRLNADFIKTMMNNAYTYGMQEIMMDTVHRFEIAELLARNINEDFNYIVRRSYKLTDLIAIICSICGKASSLISLCIVAWTLSRPVFLITVIYVIAAVAINLAFTKNTRFNFAIFRKAQVKASYLQKMPEETNIAKEIRVYGCAEEVIGSWKNAHAVEMNIEIKRFAAFEKRTFFTGLIFYVSLALAMIYLLFSIAQGTVAPDVFLVLFTLCINLFSAVTNLTRDLLDFDESLFGVEQQKNLLDLSSVSDRQTRLLTSQASPAQDQGGDKVFCAKDLSYQYANGKHALRNINLTIKRGEIIALIGENGAGKTTLVKLLLGLFQPTAGSLLFYGQPSDELPSSYFQEQIGTFFQDYYLFHHTLAENIGYGDIKRIDNTEKIKQAIEKGGAANILAKLPNGLDTLLGKKIDKRGVELSGGEKQRIALARANMSDKDILIFDEPAAMLDPIAEVEQFLSIKEKLDNRTGILISHRIGFARLADRIVMMKDGEIAEIGTHEELIGKGGLYAAFFNEQAQWYETERNGEVESSPTAQGARP